MYRIIVCALYRYCNELADKCHNHWTDTTGICHCVQQHASQCIYLVLHFCNMQNIVCVKAKVEAAIAQTSNRLNYKFSF